MWSRPSRARRARRVAADGIGSAARFGEEGASLAIGPGGVPYVSDRANRVVRKVAPDGTVTTLAGKAGEAGTADGKGAAARFGRLGGLAIDATGTIYVADEDNSTIRKIAPDGTVTTLAGKAGEPGLGRMARGPTPASPPRLA